MSGTKVSPPATSKIGKGKIVTPYESKRMTVERGVVDELLLVCGVIGTTTEGDELVPVTDCLNWLQDLQRALRRDDDTFRPISLLLQKWKVVPQKLLPLVMTCRYDTPMVLTIVKILVILTKPLSEGSKTAGRFAIDAKKYSPESVKEQIKLRENALAQSDMLMEFKRAMTHHASHKAGEGKGLFSVFVSLLAEPISKTGSARSDVDHLTIELVLHLFRNLLAAEPLIKSSSDVSQSSARLHQELVCLFESELVFEILLVIAQDMESRENQNYNLLLMELLNLLTKSQDPTVVARSMKVKSTATMMGKENKTESGSNSAGSMLRNSLKKEKQKLRQGVTTSRHSHFGGTLVVKRADGKRQYVSAALMQGSHAPPTAAKRRNRKREAFVGSTYGRAGAANSSNDPTALKAQQTIHKFCERFVADCYGPLMKSIKNEFRRDSVRLEEGDTVVFFRIVWFFCQWWRVCRKQGGLGHLIFTMDVFSHKLVLTSMDSYIQHKKYPQLSQTVALYSEMLHLLHTMYGSEDSTENIMALGLMDTLFYGAEPLDRLPKLLSKWAPGMYTRDHMCDVAEVVHMTLKLLETNAAACLKDDVVDPKAKKDKKDQQKRDAVARMKANVADFDHNAYVHRKIVSNQTVCMYTHLLSQYASNAPHVNHRIMALLIRFQKIKVAVSEEEGGGDDPDETRNQLATKTVTLEPMLYNINMILVLEQILNDESIRKDKDFTHLLSFACRIMTNFAAQAKENPLLYVESLFRHPVPHRFCEYTTNHYVNEELRMIAERELLLEENRLMMEEEDANSDAEEPEVGLGEPVARSSRAVSVPQAAMAQKKRIEDDDSDEEIEWDDADKVTAAKPGATKKSGIILSDSESDDDEKEDSPKRKRDEATEREASKKKKAVSEVSPLDGSSDEEMRVSDKKQSTPADPSGTKTMNDDGFNDDSSEEGSLDGAVADQKVATNHMSALDDVSSSDEEEPVTQ